LPVVRLEVRAGGAVTSYSVSETGFLLGSVVGCDLRLPGPGMPPLLALIGRQPGGVTLRKLAPIGNLLLNGQAIVEGPLQDGDQLAAGNIEIGISIEALAPADVSVMRVRLFDESAEERETILREREQAVEEERAQLAIDRHELTNRSQQLETQQEEINAIRSEMASIRQQLYQRYRQRRDRLAGMQEAVRKAGRRVQQQKRDLDAELEQSRVLRDGGGAYETEMRNLAGQVAEKSALLQEQERSLRLREQQLESKQAQQEAELAARARKVEEDRLALDRSQTQHQTDLVRLDRLAATLEQRQRQMQKTALEVDRRYEGLSRDTRELEEQAAQLDEWQQQLKAETDGLDEQRQQLNAGRAEIAARAAALEGQQAMLATLRTRLERMREEHRKQEQQLDEQKLQQEAAEAEILDRLAEARRVSQALQAEQQLREQQQKQFEERKATLEAAVSQLRQSHAKLTAEAEQLEARKMELESYAEQQRERDALLESRLREVAAEQQRLHDDRLALEQRQTGLVRAEQVMAALQDSLRKRNEELTARQRTMEEQGRAEDEKRTDFETHQADVERQQREKEEEFNARQTALQTERTALDELRIDLEEREAGLASEVRELVEAKQQMASTRQQFEQDQVRTTEELGTLRNDIVVVRNEAVAIEQQLPQLQTQADEAMQRLALAREQLREHLAEVHEYVRQGRADLEGLREGLGRDQQRLREQEQQLHQAQDAHRLAVAAFRQQLSEWQGQLAELKLSLAQGETRLEIRLAEVENRAQEIASASQQLAQQAEELEKQEQQVVERRQEVDRHLADMREWYRRKLRELAHVEIDLPEAPLDGATPVSTDDEEAIVPVRPGMLNATPDAEPGDRQLGELMRSLELIDAETLTALLVEARRKRRSLRQLLLQGGYLTLFQLALIEAGDLDGLVLGPVRVIDRLYATPHEAAYRVFDPRNERENLLRHLAEAEMEDAVRPDEFQQRFAALASLRHPNLAETYEVLAIAGRPAVLQEWLTGLPSSEWPALAAVPGVWFRLLSQAALGLQAAHQAGLTHGNLHPVQVIATAEGVLKLRGLGEPSWLNPGDGPAGNDVADDLRALGQCALAWSTPTAEKKGTKPKPLPESLQVVLRRLCGEEGEPYGSVGELMAELDTAGSSVPANAAAWERFIRHIREQSATP
jgi:hypothetical protein